MPGMDIFEKNEFGESEIPPELLEALEDDHDVEHLCSERSDKIRDESNRLIRDLVLHEKRIDILAEFVLGYPPQPHHIDMMRWQDETQEGMLLAWRGAAKTSFCNLTRCIFEVLQNPNVRILLVADAAGQCQGFLRSIKSHFMYNQRFREIFGDYVTGARVWSENAIMVNKRTSHAGEATITCVGAGTTLPSRHFDIIICDDLVTKDNSATEDQRKKIFDYFYETLFPTLESPCGRLWVLGTRWTHEDFYGWLQKEDYRDSTLIISVLDENDQSRWEEKYPTERMQRIRKANLAAFELQYMCRSGVGLGGIFSPEHFLYYDELPTDVFLWQGVDLAIGLQAHHDFFAHFTLAVQKFTKDPYAIEYRKMKIPFPAQQVFIKDQYEKYPATVRVVIESNAYQLALMQQVKDKYAQVPVSPRYTLKDKVARAQQVALYLTDHPLRVKRGQHDLIRLLCGFPQAQGSKDVFDAFEIALSQGLMGAKRKRAVEPGLI